MLCNNFTTQNTLRLLQKKTIVNKQILCELCRPGVVPGAPVTFTYRYRHIMILYFLKI